MPSFFRNMFVALVIMPMLWATANSINVTQHASQILGVNIPSGFEIPGLREALKVKNLVDDEKKKATDMARQVAVQALKKEVRKKYGPEAAALIPNDLTVDEAKNYNLKKFEKVLVAKGIKTVKDKAPKPKVTKKPSPKVVAAPGPKSSKSTYKKAIKKLGKLPVKGRAPMTGYSRDQFGAEWSDQAGKFSWTNNGCNTRQDVLARDLKDVKRDGKCTVVSGTLPYEKYTGKKNVKFVAGGDYANQFDIEHVVALGNAWVTGAQQLSKAERAALANDPLNLFAADPSSNRQKADADYATWVPKNKAYRCDYAVAQINVKAKYDLWVTPAEKAAMKKALKSCTK